MKLVVEIDSEGEQFLYIEIEAHFKQVEAEGRLGCGQRVENPREVLREDCHAAAHGPCYFVFDLKGRVK